MPEETPKGIKKTKKKGKWFQKIPANVLFSPGGMVLVFFAFLMEVIDWIPLPIVDQIIELPLELIFVALLVVIAKVPLKSCVAPFIIERIPVISDIIPTWVIRMLA